MNRWFAALRVLLPRSLVARAAMLVVLIAGAVLGPGVIGLRSYAAKQERVRHDLTESLLATAIAAHLLAADGDEPPTDWLSRLGEPARRVRWAGVFDREGRGLEFRRQAAITLAQIAAQIDRTAPTPRTVPLQVEGRPSARFELVTIPRPADNVILVMVYDSGLPRRLGVAQLWPAGLALIGLAVAWGWFELTMARPIRCLSKRVTRIQNGLVETAVDGVPLEELRGLVHGVGAIQRELTRWRTEATQWRHTVDARVDARTRDAARAQRHAEHQAQTDALTGLGNRRAFERDFAPLFDQHLRSGAKLALVLFDIDHFKNVNDTLGHLHGDELLAFVGELLLAARCTGGERAFRCGGDEFALLLPGASADDAVAVARRLATLFAQRARTLPSVPPPPGLSAGVAALPVHQAETWEDLLRHADQALYWAKQRACGVATAAEARRAARPGPPSAPRHP